MIPNWLKNFLPASRADVERAAAQPCEHCARIAHLETTVKNQRLRLSLLETHQARLPAHLRAKSK